MRRAAKYRIKSWSDLDARVIELALRESRAVIRRKNGVLITETHHGFLCANSGIDVSNVNGGRHALLLPEDPDRSAATLSGGYWPSCGRRSIGPWRRSGPLSKSGA